MYSRYVPNEKGGYDRHPVPDAWEKEAESREPGNGSPEADTAGGAIRSAPPHPGGHDPPSRLPGQQFHPKGPPRRPQGQRALPPKPLFRPETAPHPVPPPRPGAPGPLPFFQTPGLLGPEGLLGRLLPRGLDTEELLILAVLLLAMKQDGAGSTELLIAAAIYLLL